jgi:hypothetical protein
MSLLLLNALKAFRRGYNSLEAVRYIALPSSKLSAVASFKGFLRYPLEAVRTGFVLICVIAQLAQHTFYQSDKSHVIYLSQHTLSGRITDRKPELLTKT